MNKLWVRLALAFGFVTAITIVIVALLATYQVGTEFRRFVMHNQMVDSTLLPALAEYYADNGSWDGVESVFSNLRGPGLSGGGGRGMRRGAPNFVLADATGQVVYNGTGTNRSAQLSRQERAEAVPVEWQEQTTGYLLMGMPGNAELTGPAQDFLEQLDRLLLQAGLIAGILGILLGVAIARGLSAPLGRLATAVRQISRGELNQRVLEKGADEVADLAHAFNDMAANLQQAETLRRNLVADIAHELRTPLSVIQGNLQAILDDVYPLEKAEIAGIYDETLILHRLISDLRELAQAEAGQLSLNIQPTDLVSVIEGAVELFAELAREKEVDLEVNLPADLPTTLADPDRVRQVLHNLLTNALRHTPAGGKIGIVVEPTEPQLELGGQHSLRSQQTSGSTFTPPAFIRVSVTDTGPGIPPRDLPHVFDRFWRAARSRAREQGGSGLGLAIARQLVEAQGGQIGVESDGVPGQGSRFWFTLPTATSVP